MTALVADVLEPLRPAERPVVAPRASSRCEPVGSFPAEFLPEHRPKCPEAPEARSLAQWTSGRPLLVRVVDCKDVRVSLLVLALEVRGGGVAAEAARIDAEHVDRGLALDDPFSKLPAGSTRRGDPEAVAFVKPEVGQPRRGADDWISIRGVRDSAVVDFFDANLSEDGHPADRGLDVRAKPVEVRLKQLVLALCGGAIEITRWGPRFVRAQE